MLKGKNMYQKKVGSNKDPFRKSEIYNDHPGNQHITENQSFSNIQKDHQINKINLVNILKQ